MYTSTTSSVICFTFFLLHHALNSRDTEGSKLSQYALAASSMLFSQSKFVDWLLRAILLFQSHRSFKTIHSLDKSEKFTIAKKMLYAPRPESAFTGLVSY
jgi:hypothetical protein